METRLDHHFGTSASPCLRPRRAALLPWRNSKMRPAIQPKGVGWTSVCCSRRQGTPVEEATEVTMVGAGNIGVCFSRALRSRDLAVTAHDRNGVALEASFGNAGVHSFFDAIPIATPCIMRRTMLWHLDPTRAACRLRPGLRLATHSSTATIRAIDPPAAPVRRPVWLSRLRGGRGAQYNLHRRPEPFCLQRRSHLGRFP